MDPGTARTRQSGGEFVAACFASTITLPGTPLQAPEVKWVQCDKCAQWRSLPDDVSLSDLPKTWYCKDNTWDMSRQSCSAAEEKFTAEEGTGEWLEEKTRKKCMRMVRWLKSEELSSRRGTSFHQGANHKTQTQGKVHWVQCRSAFYRF
jgi:hypothetical protein